MDSFELKYDFPIKGEKLWTLITELKHLNKWLFPQIPNFELKVGFKTSFNIHGESRVFQHQWNITEVNPPKSYTMSWEYSGIQGISYSKFEVQNRGEHSVLVISVSGLDSFEKKYPEFTQESCTQGWNYLVGRNLKEYAQENTIHE